MNQALTQQLWNQVTGNGTDEAAKGLIIDFELVSVMDEKKTDEQGRPLFLEREYIHIRMPNDKFSEVHREVTENDKRMYPQAYKAWKEGAAAPISGTPLKEWPPIARSQVDFLAYRGLRTVEQFADVSDDGCHQLGHGYLTLRNKAQAWLLKAKDAAQVTKMAAELRERDLQIQALQRQVQELITKFTQVDEAAPVSKKPRAAANQ